MLNLWQILQVKDIYLFDFIKTDNPNSYNNPNPNNKIVFNNSNLDLNYHELIDIFKQNMEKDNYDKDNSDISNSRDLKGNNLNLKNFHTLENQSDVINSERLKQNINSIMPQNKQSNNKAEILNEIIDELEIN